MKGFDRFCIDKNYVMTKNSLFNYLNRKKEIKDMFDRNIILELKNPLIVDIGSGLSPITPIPKKTIFIDISEEALSYLRKEGYKTKHGNITKMPLKSESVDLIFCSEVLEHVKNYKKALKEMFRILKNNGKIILTIPVYKKYWGFDDEFVGHYRRFEPEVFEKEMKEAGFKIIEEKAIGSRIERGITKIAVKAFKNQKYKKLGKIKLILARWINYLIYLAVRFSLLFNCKENSSIMLYYCEKKH